MSKSCFDCEKYRPSDLYEGESYCDANKKWFDDKFKVITESSTIKCDHYEETIDPE